MEVAKAQSTLKQPLDVQPLKYTRFFNELSERNRKDYRWATLKTSMSKKDKKCNSS